MSYDQMFNDAINGNDPDRAIITAALDGASSSRDLHEGIPYTPAEMGEAAEKARDAGAAVVHVHARTDDGEPTFDDAVYGAIYDEIRDRTDVVINFSTGANDVPVESRTSYVEGVQPEVAALNMGTMNYAKFSESRGEFVFEHQFTNSFDEIRELARTMKDAGVKPELECFDTGHVGSIYPLLELGELQRPLDFSFIMGVLGGIPATVGNLVSQARHAPDDSTWQVIGIGEHQWKMVSAALSMGGNVRVGLEDNFYLPNGEKAAGNAELVEQAVEMTYDVGREPATPDEAREILGIEN